MTSRIGGRGKDSQRVPLKVLNIEDDPSTRKCVGTFLRRRGYEVVEANEGRDGIELLRREHPDVVLCDLRMPGLSGFEVLVAAAKEAPEVPVIIVSGTGDLNDAVQALKLGAFDYITKPVTDLAVIEYALQKALERARLLEENRAYRERLEVANRRLEEVVRQSEADERAARHIQFKLLPQQRRIQHGFIFERFLNTSTYLSGDFVNYFVIDEERIGFYIADVSGHGISSAFVTVLLHGIVNGILDEYNRGENDIIRQPHLLLKSLNDEMVKQDLRKYLTMFYGVLHVSNHLSYSNAGQFPFPLLCDSSSTTFIECKSTPIGLFEDIDYPLENRQLPSKFSLLLLSDGVLEIIPRETLQEKKTFIIEQCRQGGLTMDYLKERLQVAAPVSPVDDITLLLVRKHDSST